MLWYMVVRHLEYHSFIDLYLKSSEIFLGACKSVVVMTPSVILAKRKIHCFHDSVASKETVKPPELC